MSNDKQAARETFDVGYRAGKTEATLKGIAKSLDTVWDKLDNLPCPGMQERVGSLEKGQTLVLWLLGFELLAIGGLAGWVLMT